MQSSAPNKPALEKRFSLAEINDVAAEFLQALDAQVVVIFGEMGVGKTTFIKALSRQLGVADEVSSPTFALVNEYLNGEGEPMYHFDLYRLQNPEEALDIGIEEYFDSGAMCLVEWPEKILKFLPANFGVLVLKQEEGERTLRFYPNCTSKTMPLVDEAKTLEG